VILSRENTRISKIDVAERENAALMPSGDKVTHIWLKSAIFSHFLLLSGLTTYIFSFTKTAKILKHLISSKPVKFSGAESREILID